MLVLYGILCGGNLWCLLWCGMKVILMFLIFFIFIGVEGFLYGVCILMVFLGLKML